MNPKYPDIKVQLVGLDGNAFSILGRVTNAMKKANVPLEDRAEFQREATAGDYAHLLATVVRWVDAS